MRLTAHAPLFALAFGFSLSACGDAVTDDTTDPASTPGGEKSTEAPDLSGKADGAPPLSERGRLALPAGPGAPVTRTAALTDRPQAFRFQAHEGTKVRLTLTGEGGLDPYLAVDGPLPAGSGTVVGFADDTSADDLSAVAELTFDAVGAYRVQVGTYALFHQGEATPGQVTLKVECLENCVPKEFKLAEILVILQTKYGAEQFNSMVSQGIGQLFPDAATADVVRAQAASALAGGAPPEAFPVLSMAAIGTVQALLERPEAPAPAPMAVTFDLNALLTEDCRPTRSSLKPLHPNLTDLQTGSAPDYTLDDCSLQRAQDFARVLNNLALENGSAVVNGPTRYETVEDVFSALLDAGHHIVVQNNRYFADFLGLSFWGVPIAAPVWLDTGIALTDGNTLKLPAPHSHHTIIIDGPVLNATIMYYMGVSGGVSFRAVETARPHWSGERTLYSYDSATQRDQIVSLMVSAGDLRRKWTESGAALPALGYGALGVCNDSTAVMEYLAEGTVTLFPLAHPASDAEQTDGDAIDRALAALPSDLAGFDAAPALARIRQTLAFESPADGPFPGLAAQLALAP